MITDEKLTEWNNLADEATSGEWNVELYQNKISRDFNWWVRPVQGSDIWGVCNTGDENAPRASQDAKFIAAARTAVPTLIAEVRRLRAENEELRDSLTHELGQERDAVRVLLDQKDKIEAENTELKQKVKALEEALSDYYDDVETEASDDDYYDDIDYDFDDEDTE